MISLIRVQAALTMDELPKYVSIDNLNGKKDIQVARRVVKGLVHSLPQSD